MFHSVQYTSTLSTWNKRQENWIKLYFLFKSHPRHPPQLCTTVHRTFTEKNILPTSLKTVTLVNYPPSLLWCYPNGYTQRRSYFCCSHSCLFKESRLYVENAQNIHSRAFFVCTLRMCASIPYFDLIGVTSQFSHLYSYLLSSSLT